MEAFEDDTLAGCMEISDAGCSTFDFLVVTGEQKGTVWGSGSFCELIPCVDPDGRQLGFLAWYEEWLDHSLKPNVLQYYQNATRNDSQPPRRG